MGGGVICISDDGNDTQLTHKTVVAVPTKAQQMQIFFIPNTKDNDKPTKQTKKSPKLVTSKTSKAVSDEDSSDSRDDYAPLKKRKTFEPPKLKSAETWKLSDFAESDYDVPLKKRETIESPKLKYSKTWKSCDFDDADDDVLFTNTWNSFDFEDLDDEEKA